MGASTRNAPAATPSQLKTKIEVEVTLGSNGRIVIPTEVRQALELKEGDSLLLAATDEQISLTTRKMALRALRRLANGLKKPGESVVEEFIKEKRAEAARE